MAETLLRSELFMQRVAMPPGSSSQGCFDKHIVAMTLAGSVAYDVDREPFDMTAGDVVIVYPGTQQHWRVTGSRVWETTYCIFTTRPHWMPWLKLPQRPSGYVKITPPDAPARSRMADLFHQLVQPAEAPSRLQLEFSLNLVERILLCCCSIHEAQAGALDGRVQAALAHIAQHLDRPLSLDALAEAASSSRSRIASLFRRQVGMTPMAYVEQQRMRRAMQLLRYTTERVSDIALQVGFEDPHYFANRFRRFAGQSPSGYRRHGRA